MSDVFIVLAVAAVIGMVVIRQLKGEPLRGKRVMLLPAILIAVGATGLNGAPRFKSLDTVCVAASALIAAAIGLWQGGLMRLEPRDGGLWGQMPQRGLWLWVALIVSRLVVIGVAAAVGAKAASSPDSVLLTLGVNRLAQAAVIAARAMTAGVPFSAEKDGKTLLPGLFRHEPGPVGAAMALNGVKWTDIAHHLAERLANTP
jgi:hypothetical protein